MYRVGNESSWPFRETNVCDCSQPMPRLGRTLVLRGQNLTLALLMKNEPPPSPLLVAGVPDALFALKLCPVVQ